MPLNPDRNHYSVAPVGNNIIIGRVALLKGGLSRENALNLVGWLVLATNAKPDDIARVLSEASTPIGKQILPSAVETPKVLVPPVASFIGSIDPEEQAAINEAAQAVNAPQPQVPPTVGAGAKTTVPKSIVVDPEGLADAWGKVGT
jgi:hypothetical protein